ncbi:LRR receptor-like kinase [Hordeum vulgare]|nr:LRR receptor-like kinase [Hordeum vulgare]
MLSGRLPSEITGDMMLNLQFLLLGNNKFEGDIPGSLGNASQLTRVDFSLNSFTGLIPSSLGKLNYLEYLNLDQNKLEARDIQSWEFLSALSICPLTTLTLYGNQLHGVIPNSLGNLSITLEQLNLGTIEKWIGALKNLQGLDLEGNNFNGSIPYSIGNLTKLISLDISKNQFDGVMPTSMGSFRQLTHLDLSYNNIQVFILTEKKRRRKYTSQLPFGKEFLKVSHKDLEEATENFSESNLIGKGSCGSVYKGKLGHNKMEVAVKVFDLGMHGAEKSFLAECEAVRNIQHRNLLPIITVCSTADTTGNAFKALVYELMPNGNLETWLHHNGDGKDRKPLGFMKRISIALNIADVLHYLHHDIGTPIIHCDLKPSNILLDHDMIAYLGDFGIARFFRDSRLTSRGESSSNGLRGTIGYIPPEYAGGGRPSTCGDAYSFGVLLLEMLTGKRPTDSMFGNGVNIINFVDKNFPEKLFDIIDIPLQEECKAYTTPGKMVTENMVYQCLLSLVQVALSCTREIPSERMNMKEAGTRLSGTNASYLAGKDKYAS